MTSRLTPDPGIALKSAPAAGMSVGPEPARVLPLDRVADPIVAPWIAKREAMRYADALRRWAGPFAAAQAERRHRHFERLGDSRRAEVWRMVVGLLTPPGRGVGRAHVA